MSLKHIAQTVPHWAVWFAAHGWSSQPVVFWTHVHAGVASGQLRYVKAGQRFVKWFSLGDGGTFSDRTTAACVHGLIRWVSGFPGRSRCRSLTHGSSASSSRHWRVRARRRV